MEIDFPRGGAKPKPTKAKDDVVVVSQKRKQAPVEHVEKKKPKKYSKEDAENEPKVFDRYVKYDMLVEDVRGIGAVVKIEDDFILLQTINGIRVKVPIKNISRIYLQTFSKTKATLDDLFIIGQMLAFRIEQAKGNHSKEIIASICPSRVNDCLNASTLLNGIVLNGTVKSIEEKGVVMDLGFDTKLQGFAPNDLVPNANNLSIGQVMLLRIIREKNDNQRIIKVSAFPEMDTFEEEKMTMNHLTPGTVLHAEPAIVKEDGVIVNFKNNLQAFVPREQLPPRLRADMHKLVRAFRVVVVLCRQNSPFLFVSGHPDSVALSKADRRLIPSEFSVGSTIEGNVYAVDKNNNVFFSIPETDGKISLVTAKLMTKHMENPDKISKYYPGSTHKLRVLKYSLFERSLLVTNKKDLMNKSTTIQEEFLPGQVVNLTVKTIADTGVRGLIGGNTYAVIPVNHTLDLPVAAWQKAFKEGQKVRCRVLYKHDQKNLLFVTAKPAMVNSTDEIITEYDKELVNKTATGVCAKVLDQGAIVTFYNKVRAFMPASEVKKITELKPGMIVKGRILMADPESEKMTLVIGEKREKTEKREKPAKPEKPVKLKKVKPVKNMGIYTAKLAGPWIYGGTSEETTMLIDLPNGNIGRLHACELESSTNVKQFLKEHEKKPINVRVIGVSKLKKLPKSAQKKLTTEKNITRFYECTSNSKKLNEPKKKHRLLQYHTKFTVGDVVTAYCINSDRSKYQKAEVNPIYKAQIVPKPGECVSKAVIFGDAHIVKGKVTAINKSKNEKVLSLHVDDFYPEGEDEIESVPAESEDESVEDDSEDEEESGEDIDESDLEMIGAEDEDAEMTAVKEAMAKLSKTGNIFKDAKITKENLIAAKLSLQKEKAIARKEKTSKRERIESMSSVRTHSDDEEEVVADGERILHKEKILASIEKTGDLNDDTDYNRLVLSNPDASEAWISYMAYQAQDGNIDEARKVAENALTTINPREEQERLNLFTAYLNLEVVNGDEKALKAVFDRALGAFDPYEVHKRLANIYLSTKKYEELEKLYNVMIKKYGNYNRDIWGLFGTYLYKNNRASEGRDLMKKALNVINKKHHLELLTRFANLEYAHGDLERGKTMLEKAVCAAPNRGDLWNVYIDKSIKYQTVEDTRLLFERALSNKLGMQTLKNLIQKWQNFEKSHGDEAHLAIVNEKAAQFTKKPSKNAVEVNDEVAYEEESEEEEESD